MVLYEVMYTDHLKMPPDLLCVATVTGLENVNVPPTTWNLNGQDLTVLSQPLAKSVHSKLQNTPLHHKLHHKHSRYFADPLCSVISVSKFWFN